MKKRLYFIAVIVMTFGGLTWAQATDFEIGRYDDFDEAVHKGIHYEVNDVIHTTEHNGVTIVLYTTTPNPDDFPFADWEALGISFFEGNDEEGWVKLGHDGWEHHDNETLTTYTEHVREYADDGMLTHEFDVVYGEVNDAAIQTVETRAKAEESFENAEMIRKNGQTYYIQFGREFIVRGVSKTGEIIEGK